MKTPASNLPSIRTIKNRIEKFQEELNHIPSTITMEWCQRRNYLQNEIFCMKTKLANLRQGKPQLGYPDPIQTQRNYV